MKGLTYTNDVYNVLFLSWKSINIINRSKFKSYGKYYVMIT